MRIAVSIAAALALAAPAPPASASEMNLYEWLGVAPVVVAGRNLRTYGKYTDFHVEAVLRGSLAPGGEIRVNVRRANRERNRQLNKEALRFEEGLSYLLLLVPVARPKAGQLPTFELVRGSLGGREIPGESCEVWLDAASSFVELQDLNDDRHTWQQLGQMVESTNPVLLETALELFVRFRRGDPALLGRLRPLLDHPSSWLREQAVTLIGQIAERAAAAPLPDAALLQSEIVARARRDEAVPVRVAATVALGSFSGEGARRALEEIAQDDPDQEVRYAAERLLHDRRPPPRAAGPASR